MRDDFIERGNGLCDAIAQDCVAICNGAGSVGARVASGLDPGDCAIDTIEGRDVCRIGHGLG